MMTNIIVTTGQAFTDIDAYACAIAYAELLRLEGKNAEAVLPGVLNHSITPTIRSWNIEYRTNPSFKEYASVIVDISEPDHIAKCAPMDSVVEIYDHHHGFADSWGHLGTNSHIELIGACATLIWEEWKKRGLGEKMSKESANLLFIAIISNTLDFGAQITHDRDRKAAEELARYTNLPKNWKETYFKEQEATILKNIDEAIMADTKIMNIPTIPYPITVGQIELWDSATFIHKYKDEIQKVLSTLPATDWFLSSPCIKEKRNYIYTESEKIKDLLKRTIGVVFDGNTGTTDKLWLRKEIRKKFFEMKV